MNVGLLYSGEIRDNGPGHYVRFALTQMNVEHGWYWPQSDYKDRKHDVWLVVDDGRDELEHVPPHPCGFWAVDTHLGWDVRLLKAQHFDVVWTAQKEAAAKFVQAGVNAKWLPLACSPPHHPTAVELAQETNETLAEKTYDLGFVGHLQDPSKSTRIAFLDQLRAAFPSMRFRFGAFFHDMAREYHACRIGVNHSIGADLFGLGDLNMRFFELASLGVPQLCDSRMVGLEELGFRPFEHFLPYESAGEAVDVARAFLHDSDLPTITENALQTVRAQHSYRHRVETMLTDLEAL